MNSAENPDQIYKIWMNGQPGPEYFLIENRQKVGFDQYIYEGGLLIWHIDENIINARIRSNSVNNDEQRKGVDLEAADGAADMDNNRNRGDGGDPFPGIARNRLFNSSSNPNSNTNFALDSGVAIQIGDMVDQVVSVNFLLRPELYVTPMERFVASDAGAVEFEISNRGGGQMNWTASSSDPWLAPGNPSGVNHDILTILVAENTQSVSRTGTITVDVSDSDESATLTVTQSAVGEWRMIMSITDKGGDSAVLQLGQLSTATSDLDADLGELNLPPVPATGSFDARFVLPDDAALSSLADFRASGQNYLEWRVTFQPGPGGAPMVFNWDIASLPKGSFFIQDEFTGTLISEDMKSTDELVVPTPSIKSLKVVYSSSEPQLVQLKNGWNLMSLPVQLDDMNAENLFPSLVSSAFTFDNSGYTTTDVLLPGNAYWLKFNTATDISFFGSIESRAIQVTRGWNMIGPFDESVPVVNISSDPANIIASDFLAFDGTYASVEELLPSKGYWVNIVEDGTLYMNSNSPAIANTARSGDALQDGGRRHKLQKAIAENALIEIPIRVRDETGASRTLWFGLDPSASSLIDKALDEEELPPVPPSRAFDARFVGDDISEINLGEGSYRDYRKGDNSFAGTVDYELRFQSTYNSGITISWDLPEHITGRLTDFDSGQFINTAMQGQGELELLPLDIDRLKMSITYAGKPSLALTAPNGGEVLEIGSITSVTWNSTNVEGDVTIQLSRDNGSSFTTVGTAPNTGVFQWQVSPPASSECLLRISSADGSVIDQSDAVFSIDVASGIAGSALPEAFALEQNYPNPFNPTTTIRYQLPTSVHVKLVIVNSAGQIVRTLADGSMPAGAHAVMWDSRDNSGQFVSTGLYFYKIVAGDFIQTRKMILMQ